MKKFGFVVMRSIVVGMCTVALTFGVAVIIPVCADYAGDRPLTTYTHEKIRGDWRYTIGNSEYIGEIAPGDVYYVSFELDVPESSSVKLASLYAYWRESHAGEEGVYPETEVTFDGHEVTVDREYTDRKGSGDDDYPGGTYCYDVAEHIWRSGAYTVAVENTAAESRSFSMVGLVLVVIYEDEKGEELEYWINEGCDILDMKTIGHAEDAVTTAQFSGKIDRDIDNLKSATLLTIVPGGDKGENTLVFNEGIWDRVYAGDPYDELAIDARDVTGYLVAKDNTVKIVDAGDYLVPSGAFLILRYKEEEEKPAPGSTPTPARSPTATPTPVAATPAPSLSVTTTPGPETSASPSSPPTPTPSGFEAVFAGAGLLVLAVYLARRKK
ncbi:MAG: DUF3344 domain-containing protein [Methanophagales archaeon]|nr:DUF3344 domain-containing protein [Methanophagales archaeon]